MTKKCVYCSLQTMKEANKIAAESKKEEVLLRSSTYQILQFVRMKTREKLKMLVKKRNIKIGQEYHFNTAASLGPGSSYGIQEID